MAEIKQYVCDGCGAVKGTVNHWWLVQPVSGSCGWHLFPWDINAQNSPAFHHYCGAVCVHKALAQFMGEK